MSLVAANLFRSDHTAEPIVETNLLTQILSQGVYFALTCWLLYMALEPAVRRRWPDALISWNRLLSGRFKDPQLSRDILAGTLGGMAIVLMEQRMEVAITLSTLTSPRHLAYYFLIGPPISVAGVVALLFFLYLLHVITGRIWLARLLLFLQMVVTGIVAFERGDAGIIPAIALAAVIAGLLIRFGLVASAMAWFTHSVLIRAPLTLDWTTWYAGRSFAVLGFFVALLVFAFYNSLGGKPLFGKTLLDD